jgi:hypothetical protein
MPTMIPATARATKISELFAMKLAIPAKKLVMAPTMDVTTEVRAVATFA